MDHIKELLNLGLPSVIMILLGVLFAFQEIIRLIDWILTRFGIQSRYSLEEKTEKEMILQHEENFNRIDRTLNCLCAANREALADRINQKYKIYMRKGYIPEDEFEEFVNLHDAYNGVDGNHTGDAKFKKCMELPVLVEEDLIGEEVKNE
ncbi:hypothetical protein [Murimonas intestini]|uniref:Uncharacterized protein n=1 Tax=Murimonas intestini TaxID=1337051 RepID=A0AB73T1E3_9FIRM|nr:hypothetical protein [Murimonas intestini]MCR1842501.1 hypothetical protein [Murimonas intestini]MCR1867141.1 hypothetical protein [Murimonas intestini]MCR1884327.1 hypothetical protein [Murimonas intestini]